MHQDPKDVPMPEPARTQLIAKLRYMGRQYAAGQFARGGGQQKHYLEEAADEIAALSARVAELEADAGRYRWMRGIDSFAEWTRVGHYAADALDAAIDAAMKETTK